MRATKRDLVGRRIVGYEARVFLTGRGQEKTTDPALILDNGKKVWFTVQETENGEYGIRLHVSEKVPA